MRTVSKYFIVLHIGSSDACIAFLSPFFCSVYFAIDYVLIIPRRKVSETGFQLIFILVELVF